MAFCTIFKRCSRVNKSIEDEMTNMLNTNHSSSVKMTVTRKSVTSCNATPLKTAYTSDELQNRDVERFYYFDSASTSWISIIIFSEKSQFVLMTVRYNYGNWLAIRNSVLVL